MKSKMLILRKDGLPNGRDRCTFVLQTVPEQAYRSADLVLSVFWW